MQERRLCTWLHWCSEGETSAGVNHTGYVAVNLQIGHRADSYCALTPSFCPITTLPGGSGLGYPGDGPCPQEQNTHSHQPADSNREGNQGTQTGVSLRRLLRRRAAWRHAVQGCTAREGFTDWFWQGCRLCPTPFTYWRGDTLKTDNLIMLQLIPKDNPLKRG